MCEITLAGRTAISRKEISVPTHFWYDYLPMYQIRSMLHFGAGKAREDDRVLKSLLAKGGYFARFDPNHGSTRDWAMFSYQYIVCNYVLNVLPPADRAAALQSIADHTQMEGNGTVLIAVRGDKIPGTPEEDGVRTKIGTFQKSYTVEELKREVMGYFASTNVFKKGSTIYAICSKPFVKKVTTVTV